jgi:hypothetical protein
MGSCLGKYEVPEKERFYTGDLGVDNKMNSTKIKSASCKHY